MIKQAITCAVLAIVLSVGCNKGNTSPVKPDYSCSICSVVFDGESIQFNSTLPGFISYADVFKAYNTAPAQNEFVFSAQLYRSPGLSPTIRVRKGTLFSLDTIASDSDFMNFFSVGVHDWSVNAVNGVEVILIDNQNRMWSSSELGGYQGDHEFEIFESTSFFENGIHCIYFKARFECTLRHPAYGPLELTNGFFSGIVKNI